MSDQWGDGYDYGYDDPPVYDDDWTPSDDGLTQGDYGIGGGGEGVDSMTPQQWAAIFGGGGGGGGMGGFGDILKGLLSGPGKAGMGLGDILPLLLMGLGGYTSYKGGKDSTQEIKDASDRSREETSSILGGAMDKFNPYMAGGEKALGMVFDQLGKPGLGEKYATPIKSYGTKDFQTSDLKGTVSLRKLMGK